MPAISAVIITHNEAHNLGRCLASLAGVVEEVVVVDSGSTDETEAIARAQGARFFTRPWEGYASTKNWANQQAQGPYLLSLDADEELSPTLREAILAEKDQLRGAYHFARLTRFVDHWVRHGGWYPDHKVRLFPQGQARWVGDYLHESLQLDPGLSRHLLAGDLLHHSFHTLSAYWLRADRYTTLKAEGRYQRGQRFAWWRLWLRPAWVFANMYWLKSGWRDGFTGYTVARLSATYAWLTEMKLRERQRQA
jgi:glycosyltransferase involved in cell wall biosynthesis